MGKSFFNLAQRHQLGDWWRASESGSRLAASVGIYKGARPIPATLVSLWAAPTMARSVAVVFLMLLSVVCLDAIQRECLFLLSGR